jgi:hypothetical protein
MSLSPFLLVVARFWRTAITLWIEDSRLRTGFKADPALFTKRWVNMKPFFEFTFYCTCGALLDTCPTPYTLITYLI